MSFKPTSQSAGPRRRDQPLDLVRSAPPLPAPPFVEGHPTEHADGPTLPAHVTVDEIEAHLDRVALAITASPYGQEYLLLYNWLEIQLRTRQRHLATMSAIVDRVTRLRGRRGVPS